MIIVCPKCTTRYFVDPFEMGEKKRKVQCIKCSHKWEQHPDDLEPFDKTKFAKKPPKAVLEGAGTKPTSSGPSRESYYRHSDPTKLLIVLVLCALALGLFIWSFTW